MMWMKVLTTAAALAGSLTLASVAQAAPLSPTPLQGSAVVQTVAFGCGPGFHPDPWAVCHPNWGWGPRRFYSPGWGYYRPRPYYRPYGFYGPRRFF